MIRMSLIEHKLSNMPVIYMIVTPLVLFRNIKKLLYVNILTCERVNSVQPMYIYTIWKLLNVSQCIRMLWHATVVSDPVCWKFCCQLKAPNWLKVERVFKWTDTGDPHKNLKSLLTSTEQLHGGCKTKERRLQQERAEGSYSS